MQYILGNASASAYESLDHSSEEWLAECFNDTEMNFSPDDMYASLDLSFLVWPLILSIWFLYYVRFRNFSGASDIQFDIGGMWGCLCLEYYVPLFLCYLLSIFPLCTIIYIIEFVFSCRFVWLPTRVWS